MNDKYWCKGACDTCEVVAVIMYALSLIVGTVMTIAKVAFGMSGSFITIGLTIAVFSGILGIISDMLAALFEYGYNHAEQIWPDHDETE